MPQTGIAHLPLHWGSCPRWLFDRMVKLSAAISEAIILEHGTDEFLRRIADPFFFQSFGCVIGFDWHSSGLSTTTCGALKDALKPDEHGIAVLGGKGAASRRTLAEIDALSKTFDIDAEKMKYASRLTAKVDSAGVQDGYTLYHHCFFVSDSGKWAVIQQGMNVATRYARRYHWLSSAVKSFVVEPHTAICCDSRGRTLNMVATESEEARSCSIDIINDNPVHIKRYLIMGRDHGIELKRYKPLLNAYEFQPKNYEELLALRGIGPKAIRALALISALIYGAEPSWRDPACFSFAHGGKDGYPYPVDRKNYDHSIAFLNEAIESARLGRKERLAALSRLQYFTT
ncbi:MAG: DUF763 domain-containing protein [Candidatus Aenigmatarchaeota archaeon]